MVSSSVVFPAPFGPATATRSGPRRSSSTGAPVRITSASVVSTTRPRGTSVAGRSTRMVRSSRSRASASSSRSRAASSRSSCTLRYDAADFSDRFL